MPLLATDRQRNSQGNKNKASSEGKYIDMKVQLKVHLSVANEVKLMFMCHVSASNMDKYGGVRVHVSVSSEVKLLSKRERESTNMSRSRSVAILAQV